MSRDVTCAMCGRPVDDSETTEMPNGRICDDPCYKWLEQMMDEITEDRNDDDITFIDLDELEGDDEDEE